MFGIFFFSKYYTYNVHVEKQKENSLFPENFITLMIVSENQMLSPQMSVTINCADFRFSRFIICSCTISILFIIAVGRSPRSEDFFLLSGYERGKKWCEPKQLKVLSYELDSGLETNVSRPKKRSKLFHCWWNAHSEIHNGNRAATFSSVHFTSRWLLPFYHQSVFTT